MNGLNSRDFSVTVSIKEQILDEIVVGLSSYEISYKHGIRTSDIRSIGKEFFGKRDFELSEANAVAKLQSKILLYEAQGFDSLTIAKSLNINPDCIKLLTNQNKLPKNNSLTKSFFCDSQELFIDVLEDDDESLKEDVEEKEPNQHSCTIKLKVDEIEVSYSVHKDVERSVAKLVKLLKEGM